PVHSFAVSRTDVAYFAAFVLCSLAASWVSSRKRQREETLRAAHAELQVSVAERSAQLEQTHSELKESERHFRFLPEVIPQQLLGASAATEGEANDASLQDVLAEVVEICTSVVKCDSCLVYVLEGDELVLRASENPHPDMLDRLKLKVGEGITGWVAEHRE